jgi:hypothetical protein
MILERERQARESVVVLATLFTPGSGFLEWGPAAQKSRRWGELGKSITAAETSPRR